MQKTVILDAQGKTRKGIELFRQLNIIDVEKLIIEQTESAYAGSPANLTIVYKNGDTICIANGFGLGCHGTGSGDLYDILRNDLKIRDDICNQVFNPHTSRMVIRI